jgi:hypothetical protein
MMCHRIRSLSAIGGVFISILLEAGAAYGQAIPTTPVMRRIALKDGESMELGIVYFVANCKSITTGTPEVEILEGPPEITLTIKEGMVVPRTQGCTNKVHGGTIVASAKDVKQSKSARLVYRVKYKTKDGDRQVANAYYVELFP